MAWTRLGLIYNTWPQQNPVTEALEPPSVMRMCALGTTAPQQLYADPDGLTPILSDPILSGQPVGSPGLDIAGNLFAWAPPGYYTPVINGLSYAPYPVVPHVDDLAALGGAGTSASGQTLQIKTASTRTITNNSGGTSMSTAVTLADFGWVLNPGDSYRFDGGIYANSSRAAGVKIQCQASGTGAVMGYKIRGPHVSEWNQFDVTEHRDTTVTSASNGPQSFGGFAATGLSDVEIEIRDGYVALPSSAPAPGAVVWKFAQANQTADTLTIKDLMSALSVVKLT